jgi:Flp pilus assembly CpaE family ATPase
MSEMSALFDGPRDGPLTVLTAVAAPSVEAELVAGFAEPGLEIRVVRRCVDLVELMAAAAVRTARAALISADLRGLDREALAQLAASGIAVVGLAADEAAERLLHQLGVGFVVAAGAPPAQVAGALHAAAAAGPQLVAAGGSAPASSRAQPLSGAPGEVAGPGRVLAVWGPAGAPGRTTVALGVADAFAARGCRTLLVDADPYGGCVATLTGLLDEAPGVVAACRAANAGRLDVARLAECCRTVGSDLLVLTGLSDTRRWPELRASSLEVVLSLGRWLADVTVIDCGFSLEDDDDLAYEAAAPQRNAATLATLRAADRVVAVGSADPVGLSRLIRDLPLLSEVLGMGSAVEPEQVLVVANRLREGLLAGNPRSQVEEALARHVSTPLFGVLPMDVAAADAAHGRGELFSEAAPGSALTEALAGLADALIPPPSTRRRDVARTRWRPALRGRHRGRVAER